MYLLNPRLSRDLRDDVTTVRGPQKTA
jgi:hypothetical protein